MHWRSVPEGPQGHPGWSPGARVVMRACLRAPLCRLHYLDTVGELIPDDKCGKKNYQGGVTFDRPPNGGFKQHDAVPCHPGLATDPATGTRCGILLPVPCTCVCARTCLLLLLCTGDPNTTTLTPNPHRAGKPCTQSPLHLSLKVHAWESHHFTHNSKLANATYADPTLTKEWAARIARTDGTPPFCPVMDGKHISTGN